jgi:hypothetical protein|tara:strand:- start:215 stop:697 length:483 start_codon:yes stop_codon:yes gene_type:complete
MGPKFGREITYPNSSKEIDQVKKAMKTPDWAYFRLTDNSPQPVFNDYLLINKLPNADAEMNQVIRESYEFIIALKKYHNRPRPDEISDIIAAPSKTANTSAYPSGHALQSYLIAKMLSRKHPERRRDFEKIANRIADARVSVGLHYPSDGAYAKRLSKEM